MASLLLKGVHKRLGLSNLSCSSADATNVVVAVSGTSNSSSRIIDRHSPRLRDPHRSSASKPPPFSRPVSTTSSSKEDSSSSPKHGDGDGSKKKKKKKKKKQQKESTATAGGKRLVSPATSSRFLLNSSRLHSDDVVSLDQLALPSPPPPSFLEVFPGADTAVVPSVGKDLAPMQFLAESSSGGSSSSATASASGSSSSEITPAASTAAAAGRDEKQGRGEEAIMARSCSTTAAAGQVVVLKVSLHCKGCAGKVKKHISKMEGVVSFDIDIATKKVTVVGDVTPLGVLNSVSKVKAAQFWPSSSSSPPRASASFY